MISTLRYSMLVVLALVLVGCRPSSSPLPPMPGTLSPNDTSQPAEPATPTPPDPEIIVTPTTEPEGPGESENSPFAGQAAYVGRDGNLWLVALEGGEPTRLTQDALPLGPGGQQTMITYCCAAWSSDGTYLAYQREVGQARGDGFDFRTELWLYGAQLGEHRPVFGDQRVAGFTWKPGTHQLVFGLPIAEGYIFNRAGQPDASLATGIWAVESGGGEPFELVSPERGLALVAPRFSPNGRFLSFEEVYLIEGRGKFAYYDLQNQEYVAWDEPIGGYAWSPDGESLAYDEVTYTPSGTERIYLVDRQGGEPTNLSPHIQSGYAYGPVFSPAGDRLAYLAEENNNPDAAHHTLRLASPSGGDPLDLGLFEQVMNLAWTPSGEQLVFSAGPYGEQQVIVLDVASGETRLLDSGSFPALCCAAR
jgi:Tol biopolymer transport system component